jgi:hypothetical protein
LLVHPTLDALQLLTAHGLEVGKIEAQSIRSDERPLLLHVIAQFFA